MKHRLCFLCMVYIPIKIWEKHLKKCERVYTETGYIGKLAGYRKGGKSYDTDGNEIEEKHEDDCLCCRKVLPLKHES